MDTQMLMNTQLSHAEAEAHSGLRHRKVPSAPNRFTQRKTVFVLAICMALQMTSFVMILPLFARRFSEIGAGVGLLGESAMAYALAATLSAPFMGTLADRFGRRLVVLGSLGTYILAFTGYLFASSAGMFILLRGLAGALTAGLIPAVTGIVADLAPGNQRARWIGIVNGGASVGWIVGPVVGGMLYDHWGYQVALVVSILIALVSLLAAYLTIPETHKGDSNPTIGMKKRVSAFRTSALNSNPPSFRDTLPKPIFSFAVILLIYFAVMFAWAFIEPRFMFYAYDNLGWNSSMLGLVMSTYGIAMALGEFGLSHLSDRLGRKPVILLGLALFSAQFIGLAFFRNYMLIAVSFVIAGLGNALFDPAISASILDIAPAKYLARLMGIKSTAGSLGSIIGPALIVLFSSSVNAGTFFLISAGVVLLTVLLGLTVRIGTQSPRNESGSNFTQEKTIATKTD
jgi:MFS family permease